MHVFAYGSLLWNPGFEYEAAVPALARGWQRKWCVRSVVHRGTADAPGFVLGLVPGGSCVGRAYRVKAGLEAEVTEYLHEREMAETGYRPTEIEIEVPDGKFTALTFVADACCYEPSLDDLIVAARSARGVSGANRDYLFEAIKATRNLVAPEGWPEPCPGLPTGAFERINASAQCCLTA